MVQQHIYKSLMFLVKWNILNVLQEIRRKIDSGSSVMKFCWEVAISILGDHVAESLWIVKKSKTHEAYEIQTQTWYCRTTCWTGDVHPLPVRSSVNRSTRGYKWNLWWTKPWLGEGFPVSFHYFSITANSITSVVQLTILFSNRACHGNPYQRAGTGNSQTVYQTENLATRPQQSYRLKLLLHPFYIRSSLSMHLILNCF